ncbi:prepilin peptidase CpaA [Orbus hercynius]|uniref:Prepilin peptidase CpaA n=1 Tax=Orbus hercynius TaxID=593135 RepID=A0A495RKM1_9GAMM|nr:prepilin peptidase [Orbus hercynius]RKS87854.1 prepilin peptidase CpaA [Orbus hercynius]
MMIDKNLFNNIIILAIWLLLCLCCYTDIRYRIISNYVVITVFILVVLNHLFGLGVFNYIVASVFLFFGIIIFYCRLIGAGDIKLITVLLFSIPSPYVVFFLIMITIAGLPLALIAILYKVITQKKVTLPYGLAISASYILTSMTMFVDVPNRFVN